MATGDKLVKLDSLKTAYDTSAKFTAPMEASSTASAAHAAGEHFIYNGILYVATTDIASGATITPGTNCRAVTGGIGAEIGDLKSTLLNCNAYDVLYDVSLDKTTSTVKGITYTSTADGYSVSGTATAKSVKVLLASSALPNTVVPGKTYFVKYKTTNQDVRLRIIFRDSSDTDLYTYCFTEDKIITVPTNATKWTIGLVVENGTVILVGTPAIISEIAIVTTKTNEELQNESFMGRNTLPDNTSFDDVRMEGHWSISSDYSYTHTPIDGAFGGTLEVIVNSDNIILQRVQNIASGRIYTRQSVLGVFTDNWEEVALTKNTVHSFGRLANGSDFDDLKAEGYWGIAGDYSYIHNPLPPNFNGTIEVLKCNHNVILQRVTNAQTSEVYLRTSVLGVFNSDWSYIGAGSTLYLYTDLNDNQMIHMERDNLFYNENNRVVENNSFRSKLIPVKKGDSVYLRSHAGSQNGKAWAKVTYNYLIDEKYDGDPETFDGTLTFDYDGFLAVNLNKTYDASFKCIITPANVKQLFRKTLFENTLLNETYQTGEYDPDNVCRVLKMGPSMMGAIHHWGIIGASYDSGELNYTVPNTSVYSSIDWYEYSWGQYLKRINAIPDLYNYSNGGQNSKEWIILENTDARGHFFATETEELFSTSSSGREYRGVGIGGGCWWKMKSDHENGNTKQAFILVLGSNDINNNYPHDENWNVLETYDETRYYKCGTIDDIGTYDYATDTDTVPTGKTAGVVPGIVNSYAAYIGAILNRIIAIQPDAIIFVATIRNDFSTNKNKQDVWKEYNAVLRQIVQMDAYKDNCYLLDYAKFGPSYESKRFREIFVGQHPNAMAYQLAAYYYNTIIDYVIMNNLKDMKLSALIGTGKVFTPV